MLRIKRVRFHSVRLRSFWMLAKCLCAALSFTDHAGSALSRTIGAHASSGHADRSRLRR